MCLSLNQTLSKGTFLLLLSEGGRWWYFASIKFVPEVPVVIVSALLHLRGEELDGASYYVIKK